MDPFDSYRKPQQEERQSMDGDFQRFERDLKRLRVEFEKFFNGALAVPPEDQQQRLANELRRMRTTPQMTSAESFRLNGLEARFNSYCELFGRRQRDLEEGRTAAAKRAAMAQRADPEAGMTVRENLSSEVVEALFEGLCRGAEPPRFDLDTFGRYLGKQLDQIREKSGNQAVQFRVERDGTKMKLKAKPIRE
ncbi:MAG: hypothetical protein SX243_10280 [Acidobacteriota bacterium]|nr:hypothetical protein [Acidobacteriota bacterium]